MHHLEGREAITLIEKLMVGPFEVSGEIRAYKDPEYVHIYNGADLHDFDLAASRGLLAAGARHPAVFTFCRKAVGIGTTNMAERWGVSPTTVAAYKAGGFRDVPAEWWALLEREVAAAEPLLSTPTVAVRTAL